MDGNNDDDDMAAAAGGGAGGGGRVVQKILQSDAAGGRLLVKFAGLSYRKADWLDAACVEAARPSLVTAFRRKGEQLQIDPQWLVIDRVVAHRPAHSDGDDDEQEQEASSEEEEDEKEIEALLGAQKHDDDGGKGEEEKDEEDDGSEGEERGGRRKKEKKSAEKEEESEVVSARERRRQLSAQYLVRWRGLDACEATWESGAELAAGGEADAAALQHYLSRLAAPWPRRRPLPRHKIPADVTPQFRNGRSLRDYQLVGLRWMVHNYMRGANCILGDEMGLGKTAQSTSVLEYLRAVGHVDGPFLVIAPVSTLGHWQREIRTWTDMEVVVYAGSADDRAAIQAHEMYHDASGGNGRRGGRGGGSSASRPLKFHVLLTSFETALKDRGVLGRISWEAAIIDEAHRLKSQTAATRAVIEELSIGWKLLLTGTPIQNNMAELFSILNLLDSDTYDDLDEFLESYGGRPGSTPTVAQIQALQEVLKPVLLRCVVAADDGDDGGGGVAVCLPPSSGGAWLCAAAAAAAAAGS